MRIIRWLLLLTAFALAACEGDNNNQGSSTTTPTIACNVSERFANQSELLVRISEAGFRVRFVPSTEAPPEQTRALAETIVLHGATSNGTNSIATFNPSPSCTTCSPTTASTSSPPSCCGTRAGPGDTDINTFCGKNGSPTFNNPGSVNNAPFGSPSNSPGSTTTAN